ncbi:hypothetical protein GGX14DRAFT_651628 [Mycena pura]|uniref:Uncharacterized protein n=1 Tax=Mycena pura TaxID=153505 RepID=A0AAD6Y7H1_9AGAR|nr:hypothetical protein GGX14DRAFT_651628 [Mycena pura]
MFSSLSNFLPAALHPSPQKVDPQQQIRPDDDDDDDDAGNKSDVNETGVLKKKKDKNPNETFIFVRPPPAKTNHPLNLQVQLIPPNSRGPSGLTSASRQSLDLSTSASASFGAALARTSSARSDGSTHSSASTYSSSSTSTTSSRRMIVPLYNLQAHNVMTNTIVDAGTDAKIAKFNKRGIEMLDLAVLEPIEVHAGGGAPEGPPGAGSAFSTRTVGGRPSATGALQVPGAGAGAGGSRPGTPDPTSSQASLASSSAHSQAASYTDAPALTPTATPQGKRHLFGKLFKKKDAAAGEKDEARTPTPGPMGHARKRSVGRSVSPNPAAAAAAAGRTSIGSPRASVDLGSEEAHQLAQAQAQAQATVLGVLPSVSAPTRPPRGRPGLYVWVVRRWMKGDGGGLLGVAKGIVRGHGHGEGDLTSEIEVRFEWKRGKAKRRALKDKGDKGREDESGQGHGPARRHASAANLSAGMGTPSKRLSRHSSFSTAASEEGHAGDGSVARRQSLLVASVSGHGDEDSGEESDPEDSETPWTCTDASGKRDKDKDKEGLRVKVGTLSPTPHHPKVVAMLKVPFPLPDVDVERMVARKRETGPGQGSLGAKPAHTPSLGLLLTAEEIKDVVCSTGLWLVVREGFGGIGKINRKGDGWRIRG